MALFETRPNQSAPRIGICKEHGWYWPLDNGESPLCPEGGCESVVDLYTYDTSCIQRGDESGTPVGETPR